MKYDGVLVALYILALAVIALEFFSMTALTVVIVLLMVMIAVQKIGLEKMIKKLESERDSRLEEIATKIDDVSKKIDNIKDDVERQVVFVDSKVAEVRGFAETEMTKMYGEFSRRAMEIEDKLSEFKQDFAAAVGSMDERIRGMEQEEEPTSDAF